MNWTDFSILAVNTLRPAGFFTDPLFDDPARYCPRLAETLGIDGAHADFDAMPELVYDGLFAIEGRHTAAFNTKKAAAETGPGYYTDVVTRILACVCTSSEVRETRPEPGITTVHVTAQLNAAWGDRPAQARQNFSDRSFTDGIFMQQLMMQLLGDDLRHLRLRASDEEQVYIFPPSAAAAKALADFEAAHLAPELASEALSAAAMQSLPQPTAKTVEALLASQGFARPTPRAQPGPAKMEPSADILRLQERGRRADKISAWISRIAWGVAGLMVLRLIYMVLLG